MIGSGNKNRGLYFLDRNVPQSQMFLAQGGDLKLWHCRLGHLNAQSLKILKNQNLVKGLENANLGIESKCEICAIGKMTKLPSKPLTDDDDQRGASKKLELIHSDVCGPVNITGYNGANYFVTFIDDYSRKSWIYTMKFKSEVLSRFKEFAEMVNNKGEEKIQMILSDNGGEYTSEDFKNYCKSKGIEQFHSSPYSPNQNGTAERYNRTIVEMTRCLLHESGLTLRLWPEALLTAAHIRNRSPHSSLENKITPEEAWSGQKPSINHLRKWGCKVSVLIPNQFQDNKFSSKVWWGSLVGFAGKQLGYRIWSSEKQRVFTRRDVRFFEDSHLDNTHSFVPPQQEKLQDNEEITVWFKSLSEQRKESEVAEIEAENDAENEPIQNQLEAEEESNQIMSPRRSTRERRPPERLTSSKLGEVKLAHGLIHSVDPQSYEEAMQSLERKEWEKAMKEEIQSLEKNNTWKICELPKGSKCLGLKWVFKRKYHSDGKLERYKARLVVKGYEQKYGIDYGETFSPVIRKESLRLLLALATYYGLQITQMDVKTAFLYGELEEEIYVNQPVGFEAEGQNEKVLKLGRAMYGLKQAPRQWNIKLNMVLEKFGLVKLESDNCVYVSRESGILIVGIYVDDLIIIGKDEELKSSFKRELEKEFEMKDLGKLKYILGIEVEYLKNGLKISQKKYVREVLTRFGMENKSPLSTPSIEELTQEKNWENQEFPHLESSEIVEDQLESKQADAEQFKSKFPYREAIGALQYLSVCTRPDISMAVSSASRFMEDPKDHHIGAVRRIFRYLVGTIDRGIVYRRNESLQTIREAGVEDSSFLSGKSEVDKCSQSQNFSKSSNRRFAVSENSNFQNREVEESFHGEFEGSKSVAENFQVSGGPRYRELKNLKFEVAKEQKLLPDSEMKSAQSKSTVLSKSAVAKSPGASIGKILSDLEPIFLQVFSDSSWASERENSRSREGFVAVLASGAISWQSRLQRVTLSSTEAEYLSANESGRELVFLNEMLDELGVNRDKSILFLDNSSAIKQTKNPVFHKRSKHVKIKYHWIRQALREQDFKIEWIPTEQMSADFLTKPVDQKTLNRNLISIGFE